MRPFLRPLESADDLPEGWVVEAAGTWNDRAVEVAYDLRRHDVLLARGAVIDDQEPDLVAGGWEYASTDGFTSMSVRDRLEVGRTRLAADSAPAAPQPEGPSPHGPSL